MAEAVTQHAPQRRHLAACVKDNARRNGFFPGKRVRRKFPGADRTDRCVSTHTADDPSLAALKGEAGEHQAKALLANFTHTILHAVDPITAEWAAKKLGRRRETLFSASSTPDGDAFDALFGDSKVSGSFNGMTQTHEEPGTIGNPTPQLVTQDIQGRENLSTLLDRYASRTPTAEPVQQKERDGGWRPLSRRRITRHDSFEETAEFDVSTGNRCA